MSLDVSRRSLIGGATLGTALISSAAARGAVSASSEPPSFGPAPGVAQLSRNENPYGPAPAALRAIAASASKGCYYTESGMTKLSAMVAERLGVAPDHVVLGAGSTEVLSAAALAWRDKGAILCAELFWDATAKYAERQGATLKRVALRPDMGVDLDGFAAQVGPDIGLVHICNPNNPTGMVLDGDALRAFIRKVGPQVTVLVDEAYNELTERPAYSSMIDLVREGRNVIVTRTFSKLYGMAGLRVGYAIAAPDKVDRIRSHIMGFGVNTSGLAAAMASYQDDAFAARSLAHVVEAREILLDAVRRAGLTALPSQANFLFVKVPDANAVQKAMAERDVVIRGAYGKWNAWSRVSTGRIEDVKRYAAALPRVLEGLAAV